MTGKRLPDFIIIGLMKCGTTSLHAWLGQQPEVFVPGRKEPDFFSSDAAWEKGLGWYRSLFGSARDDQLTGEASVSYTHPALSAVAARRIAAVLPSVQLICVLREPIERLRSHYRHELQRGREKRSFQEAIRDPANPYLAQSRYFQCTRAYFSHFPPHQMCFVRLEDLTGDQPIGWDKILRFLRLGNRPSPGTVLNVTREKGRFTRPMLMLWKSGLLDPLIRLPKPIRAAGKRMLIRRDKTFLRRLRESEKQRIPEDVANLIWADVARLEARLVDGAVLWPRQPRRSSGNGAARRGGHPPG